MAQQEDAGNEERSDEQVRSTFHKSVDEGTSRLERTWTGLLSTGFVGGLDVSLGVLALLVVEHETGSRMLGALAFTIGFIALTLGKSELFTENFLLPVYAVITRSARPRSLLRLWAGTALANLVAGWAFGWIIVYALPRLHGTTVQIAAEYPQRSAVELLGLGILAGVAITLMTWMVHGARSEFGQLVAVSAIAFLLAAVPLNHVIVVSIEMFAALETGQATFGYLDWARVAGIATLSNMMGGLLLVTSLRLAQVGLFELRKETRHRKGVPRDS